MLAVDNVMVNFILLQDIGQYVTQLFSEIQTPVLLYHNLQHT